MKVTRQLVERELFGPEAQQRLREGIPEIGWQGDPWLTLYWNHLRDSWEVWDEQNEKPVLVCQKRADDEGTFDIHRLCIHLRNNDMRHRTFDEVTDKLDRENDALEAAALSAQEDRTAEQLERVYWSLGKDLGVGRPVMSVPDAIGRWRSNDKQ